MTMRLLLGTLLAFNANLIAAELEKCPMPFIGFNGPYPLDDTSYTIARADHFGTTTFDIYIKKTVASLELQSANLRREMNQTITSRAELAIDRSASRVSFSIIPEEIDKHVLQVEYGKWVECTNNDHRTRVLTDRTLFEISIKGN